MNVLGCLSIKLSLHSSNCDLFAINLSLTNILNITCRASWISIRDILRSRERTGDFQHGIRVLKCFLIPIKMQKFFSDDEQVRAFLERKVKVPETEYCLVSFEKDQRILRYHRYDPPPKHFRLKILECIHLTCINPEYGTQNNWGAKDLRPTQCPGNGATSFPIHTQHPIRSRAQTRCVPCTSKPYKDTNG